MTILKSLSEVLPHAAAQYGDDLAAVFGDREFSFSELDELASRLANGLAGLGIGVGDVVTLYSANRWEWLVSYYGVLKLGAVINPINVMLTPSEVEFVARDCGARAIIASGEKGVPILGVCESSDVEHIVLFENSEQSDSALLFSDLIKKSSTSFKIIQRPGGEMSTICYTSGTTGHPKGTMQSHEAVLLNAAMTAQMHMRTAEDVVVTALPLPHAYGNVVMNGAIIYGMTLVVHTIFDEEEVLASIEQYRATMFEGVPTMYMYLLNHAKLDETDISSLTRCTVGGQTMPIAKMKEVEARFGCPLLELWGMTELAGLGTTHPFYGPNRHGSVGIALPYTELRIADISDATKSMPTGEVGELVVRGPFVMQGYFGNDQATAETIEKDGWMHTGDLASMDEKGYVFIVDRKKDMILTAGYNVYPAEIERVLAGHPSVAMVAVGPVKDEVKGEIAKAYVVLKDGCEAGADDIIQFCRADLAAYKVPRDVQFVPDLPKTSSGKVMRRELHTLDA